MSRTYTCKWPYECYMCACPLNIYHTSENYNIFQFVDRFDTYCRLNPFFVDNNTSVYKFFGNKLRRVCIPCFDNKCVFSVEMHHERQLGIRYGRRTKSKTKGDVFQWCQAFNRYLSRTRDI